MKRALVIGGSGLVGTHLSSALVAAGGWDVVATQRRPPSGAPMPYRVVALDLEDRVAATRALARIDDVSHVFFLARTWREGYVIERDANVEALAIVLDALQDRASLVHVQLVHGLKWYGSTRGPFRVPALETDPSPDPDHFYVAQQAMVDERSRGRGWHWTAWRPHCVSGVAIGSPSNVMLGMAAHATLAGAAGATLAFPGSEAAFRARLNYTDAELLAAAMVWAADAPAARDQVFNVANGDGFSWQDVWADFAARFGCTTAPPRPTQLHREMPAQAARWRDLAVRHGLREADLARLVDWHFMDATLALGWDQLMSLDRLRASGFVRSVSTPAMIDRIIDGYRRLNVLPPAP